MKGSDGKVAWNDCRGDATTNATTDDVGFIGALIDKGVADMRVDPRRAYVFGFSNGGGHVDASKDEGMPWLLKKILGPMNHDVDTADEAWRFFRTKTR